jgi:hypothetical protein
VFCHATFAPDEGVRAIGLSASERTRRDAALARHRQERTTVAGYASHAADPGVGRDFPATVAIAAVAAMLAPVFCIVSCASGLESVTGEETESAWGTSLGTGVAGIVMAVVAALLGRAALRRIRETKETFRVHAESFGGNRVLGLLGTAHWLGAHWAGPYDLAELNQGERYVAAEGVVAGYPWLFELAPAYRRAQVLVAAFFAEPPDLARSPDAAPVLAELDAMGARTTVDEAGVRARFDPSVAAPEQVHALRDRLVFLAARLGGRPLHGE